MKKCIGSLLLLSAVSLFAAPPPGKQPWKWTDEERLAVRFDPHAMAERKAAYATSVSRPANLGQRLGPGLRYVIDGRRNPELFLRHELLDDLVHAYGRTGAEEAAVCAARIEMLAAAEKRFGKDRFDQFLYTAIAPAMIHTESTNYPDPAGRLRREAGGCK